ncbi:hypothetical protein HG537_0E01460 [Torulaspora globosa]|uniref:DNA recombination and repair protein Rad51-like C-terminal domain-containing protein n=1 Tax=Torulaspora globosa TaxID=48254 RepID=A0A7H9HTX1_9SACH|nr:hypothetical protein HG537_0E01460 [Torulaspora sp. CBS 2947]
MHCCGNRSDLTFLVVDIVSEWETMLYDCNMGFYVMNSTSIHNMEGLVNFLLQLNESPREALMRCRIKDSQSKQLAGIVIDNISYLSHDVNSYNLLIRTLKMLRNTFGCWILTVSYGLEYYNGVENALASPHRAGSLTRVPLGYTNEMDAMIIRDTDSTARLCS